MAGRQIKGNERIEERQGRIRTQPPMLEAREKNTKKDTRRTDAEAFVSQEVKRDKGQKRRTRQPMLGDKCKEFRARRFGKGGHAYKMDPSSELLGELKDPSHCAAQLLY